MNKDNEKSATESKLEFQKEKKNFRRKKVINHTKIFLIREFI